MKTNTKIGEAEMLTVAKYKCMRSLLFHTRYFFKKRYKRKFVVGEHHVLICEALEKVLRGEITHLIINIAPRYGKTELAVKNFISHALGLNPAAKFIHLSYADDLAKDNSEDIKDTVQTAEYQEMFPDVKIKKDSKAKKKWYTTEGGGVYATAAAGQVTGFGAGKVDDEEDGSEVEEEDEIDAWLDDIVANIDKKQSFSGAIIIDDPIKPEDADSEAKRKKVNERFDSTIRNRVNSRRTPIIIIMQRLHEDDLCGHLQKREPNVWTVLSLPSIKADGTALWSFKHTLEELLEEKRRNPIVFSRQHMQDPLPLEGRLYKTFRTYKELPGDAIRVKAVADTADTGTDFLCSIVYSPTVTGYYVLDVYYTQDGMEITEEKTAKQYLRYGVASAKVESNNGGKGFARNVIKYVRIARNTRMKIIWFHQSKNKLTRIYTNAADVQNMIVYPEDWDKRWPEFYNHVTTYMATGKNLNDDAEDALTMIIEEEAKPAGGSNAGEHSTR